jgi:hypothetical protein
MFCLEPRASAVGEGASRLYTRENVRGEQMRQARLSDDMHVSHNRIQFGVRGTKTVRTVKGRQKGFDMLVKKVGDNCVWMEEGAFRPVTKRSGRNGDPSLRNIVTSRIYKQAQSGGTNAYHRQSPYDTHTRDAIRIHADCPRTSARIQNPAGASP